MIRALLLALLCAPLARAAETSAVEALFAAVEQDGPLDLPEAARQQLGALLPAAGRGQQCAKPAEAHEAAVALKDRGDGALLIAMISSCHGEAAYAFSPGQPTRVAKLFDNDEGRRLIGALSLPLRGGSGAAEEVGLILAGHTTELRFFVRRSERGFTFAPAGAVPDFSFSGQCEGSDADHRAGFQSLVRVAEARRLLRLRLESRCGGGLSDARCEVWHFDQGQLEKRGGCALPARLEEAELRKAGWR